MLLPLSSSVSTAGEALNLKLDYSLTKEQTSNGRNPTLMSSSDTMDSKENEIAINSARHGIIANTFSF